MRIYNGKKSQVVIPLVGSNQKIEIAPKSVSGDFMPNKELLSLIMTTFDYSEIALITSGPFEISMCSQVSGCVGFVVYSLEEAIERFPAEAPKPERKLNPALLSELPTKPEPEKILEPVGETKAPVEKVDEKVTNESAPEVAAPKRRGRPKKKVE